MILKNKRLPVNASGGLLPMRPSYRRNTGFPSAYPVPRSTPFADFGRGILDAFAYTPDPKTTYMERVGKGLATDMESMISGFDAKGSKVPDSLRMMSLMMPGSTGLGGKAGVGILGAATGAVPKVGSAYASRLIPTLENMPQEKMSAEQFSGWLSKQQVGADELEYSGIPSLLAQGGDVTKTGLLNQARANPLDIQDVVLGEPKTDISEFLQAQLRAGTKLANKAMSSGYSELDAINITNKLNDSQISVRDLPDELRGDAADYLKASGDLEKVRAGQVLRTETKFSDYQLPGGEDYKEMLLTLPDKGAIERKRQNDAGIFTNMSPDDYPEPFTGGHFDQPNVLAHARYNTRTIDGDKTLFIEEIQSDWHQKGRDVGYASESDTVTKALQAESDAIINRATIDPAIGAMTIKPEDLPRYNELQTLIQERRPVRPDSVPDAPYKRTDKWAGLTLQRMIKEAVDSGHDRIAWTPGKVQAERYDLSKQVDTIRVEKLRDGDKAGQYYVTGEKNGSAVGLEEVVTEDKLPDLIGKDLADKATKDAATGKYPDGRDYSGVDLQVGGEGMEEFYDKMLVKSANKFGKKYGAKAELTKLKRYQRTQGEAIDTGIPQSEMTDENLLDELGYTGPLEEVSQEVWSMKITPEMKAGISKGVMLGKTGAEGKIAAGLLSQNEEEQMPSGLPVRGLFGGTLYTATTPDGFI